MSQRRVVITGGSGFVGTNLVEYFSGRGWELRNFDIRSPRNSNHYTYWTDLDILHRDRLIDECRKFQPSTLLHFAARTDLNEKHDITGYEANVDGVVNILRAIQSTPSIQRVVFASSQLVCELGYQPEDEHDYRPSTLYGQSKMLMEKFIRLAELNGVIWTILRPTSLWGPWFDVPYKNFFVAISRNLYAHPGSIRILKRWGFVGNSVFQIYRLIEAPAEQVHQRMFYLADYQPIEFREFANKVQKAVGAKPIKTAPIPLLRTAARIGDLGKRLGWANPPITSFRYHNIITNELQDLQPLQEVTGPLPYSVDQGIEMTVEWLREFDTQMEIH